MSEGCKATNGFAWRTEYDGGHWVTDWCPECNGLELATGPPLEDGLAKRKRSDVDERKGSEGSIKRIKTHAPCNDPEPENEEADRTVRLGMRPPRGNYKEVNTKCVGCKTPFVFYVTHDNWEFGIKRTCMACSSGKRRHKPGKPSHTAMSDVITSAHRPTPRTYAQPTPTNTTDLTVSMAADSSPEATGSGDQPQPFREEVPDATWAWWCEHQKYARGDMDELTYRRLDRKDRDAIESTPGAVAAIEACYRQWQCDQNLGPQSNENHQRGNLVEGSDEGSEDSEDQELPTRPPCGLPGCNRLVYIDEESGHRESFVPMHSEFVLALLASAG